MVDVVLLDLDPVITETASEQVQPSDAVLRGY